MKITIYELLGLIKEGKAPKKIKYNTSIYLFDGSDYYDDGYALFQNNLEGVLFECLNDVVEVTEEKEIEKFEFGEIEDACHYEIKRKVNELIDIVKELRSKE